jgi:hypothetical protein
MRRSGWGERGWRKRKSGGMKEGEKEEEWVGERRRSGWDERDMGEEKEEK